MNISGRHILVVDDERNIRKLLAGVLEDEGYTVTTAGDTDAAEQVLLGGDVDLLLLDVRLPGADGLTFLKQLQQTGSPVPVLMMSGHGTIDTAVAATRLGALDFIEKPIQAERLLLSVANGLRLRQLQHENVTLRRSLSGDSEILGESAAIQRVREEIARAAPTEARVLITGENGTGKELAAAALHTGSDRTERPFIKVNCAAIPSELLESELFGHERGAFTGAVNSRRGKFELAQHGTLLLDEIGDMNPTTQAKLLRLLEEGELTRVGGERSLRLDVRIFASTNQDLDRLMREGGFRQDLYHRLKVIPIHLPPLRERPGDVALLARHFYASFGRAMGRPGVQLTPEAVKRLEAYPWPGNVRELRNLMERAVIMADHEDLDAAAISRLVSPSGAGSDSAELFADIPTLTGKLEAFEQELIRTALHRANGNIAQAARQLGLDRANLYRKIQRLGLRSDLPGASGQAGPSGQTGSPDLPEST
ncbi:MAG: sigma-54 dependent transcriptional regulator [bacterium]